MDKTRNGVDLRVLLLAIVPEVYWSWGTFGDSGSNLGWHAEKNPRDENVTMTSLSFRSMYGRCLHTSNKNVDLLDHRSRSFRENWLLWISIKDLLLRRRQSYPRNRSLVLDEDLKQLMYIVEKDYRMQSNQKNLKLLASILHMPIH
ncbi:hypothetical protein Tco_0017444 [Tanacetum coccineum]